MTKIAFLPLAYGYEVCPPLARWRADELSVIEKHPTLLQGVDVVCIFYLWCIFHNHLQVKVGLYGLWSAMPDAEFLTLFISIPLLKWKPSAFSQK